jgi:hypothetical protein
MSLLNNYMKRFFVSLVISFFVVSCSTLSVKKQVSDNQNILTKQEQKIDTTVTAIEKIEQAKNNQTAALSAGIKHSLDQVTNPPVQVDTAKALNERVVSIIGSPQLDEMKRIIATVNLLNSQVAEERKRGEELLNQRDKIIIELQKQNTDLKQKYDDQLWQMNDKAKEIAKESDAKQSTIDSMGGMFGLNAVVWGLKKFFFSALTGILIFVVIFVILRLLAAVNPIAGAAFSIFNMLGSLVIQTVKGLTPKAFEMSHLTSSGEVEKYKNVLVKIVDTIQTFKLHSEANPSKTVTLTDILDDFAVDMNDIDKDVIKSIKKDLKWK